jgi:hypothetical protein
MNTHRPISNIPGLADEERENARPAAEKIRIARANARRIGQRLRKRKQTFIQWLGSGAYHYCMMFFGIWVPETKLGVVGDICRLQEEQERIMAKLAYKADCHRSLGAGKPTLLQYEKEDLRYRNRNYASKIHQEYFRIGIKMSASTPRRPRRAVYSSNTWRSKSGRPRSSSAPSTT